MRRTTLPIVPSFSAVRESAENAADLLIFNLRSMLSLARGDGAGKFCLRAILESQLRSVAEVHEQLKRMPPEV